MDGSEDAALSAARLCRDPHTGDELRPRALERSRRSSTLIATTARQPATDRRGQVRADRLCQMPLRQDDVRRYRRSQGSDHNSGFGTVYGIVDGKPLPVCDYAGFAPFGFGYRRCPGEQLTIQVFEDFLRKVWKGKIEFQKLDIANPEPLPIGPTTVIGDNVGFSRTA